MTDFNLVTSRVIRRHAHARRFDLSSDERLAWEFKFWFNKNNGRFVGKYPDALAISHAQVCKTPIKMFVVKEDMVGKKKRDVFYKCKECGNTTENKPAVCLKEKCTSEEFEKHSAMMTRENYFFPDQVIVNAEIVEMLPTVLRQVKKRRKGILGWFMPRKKKWIALKNVFPMVDACMSFPLEDEKQVLRANIIKVRYQIITPLGLKTIEEEVHGMKSHIFQHEIDHQNSVDIHQKGRVIRFKENNGKNKEEVKKEKAEKKKAGSKKLNYSGKGRQEDCARCRHLPKGQFVKGHDHRL